LEEKTLLTSGKRGSARNMVREYQNSPVSGWPRIQSGEEMIKYLQMAERA